MIQAEGWTRSRASASADSADLTRIWDVGLDEDFFCELRAGSLTRAWAVMDAWHRSG